MLSTCDGSAGEVNGSTIPEGMAGVKCVALKEDAHECFPFNELMMDGYIIHLAGSVFANMFQKIEVFREIYPTAEPFVYFFTERGGQWRFGFFGKGCN